MLVERRPLGQLAESLEVRDGPIGVAGKLVLLDAREHDDDRDLRGLHRLGRSARDEHLGIAEQHAARRGCARGA
jgi:hypothetical protein